MLSVPLQADHAELVSVVASFRKGLVDVEASVPVSLFSVLYWMGHKPYRAFSPSPLQASSNAAVLSAPVTYWVTYDNAQILVPGTGAGEVNDTDPLVQHVTNDPNPGETVAIAPDLANGSPMLLGAKQLATTLESAWLYYGAAAKVASGVDPESADPVVSTCSSSVADGWDIYVNGVSGSMFHEHMHQFIGG